MVIRITLVGDDDAQQLFRAVSTSSLGKRCEQTEWPAKLSEPAMLCFTLFCTVSSLSLAGLVSSVPRLYRIEWHAPVYGVLTDCESRRSNSVWKSSARIREQEASKYNRLAFLYPNFHAVLPFVLSRELRVRCWCSRDFVAGDGLIGIWTGRWVLYNER